MSELALRQNMKGDLLGLNSKIRRYPRSIVSN
jgi:hypothetical protein